MRFKVTMKILDMKRHLHFEFSDTGVGIQQTEIQKLYHAFEKGNNEEELTATEGAGMGLYLTSILVQKLGGTIAIESREGACT